MARWLVETYRKRRERMKIYLTKNDVLEILAERFGLKIIDASTKAERKSVLVWDELHWEGNKE